MQNIKDALAKEAKDWLTTEHTLGDWGMHCIVEPSSDLELAYQSSDIEDDEEFEDAIDPLIAEAYEISRK